ncbi:MAG: hypothetical protein ABW213_08720, partial [Tardiphaga sp.]
ARAQQCHPRQTAKWRAMTAMATIPMAAKRCNSGVFTAQTSARLIASIKLIWLRHWTKSWSDPGLLRCDAQIIEWG